VDELIRSDGIAALVREGERVPHESGHKHVTGTAEYIDDIAEPIGTLHAYLGLSGHAHAEILDIDLRAVASASGVVGVLTAADIPGVNDISPAGIGDDCSARRAPAISASRSLPSSDERERQRAMPPPSPGSATASWPQTSPLLTRWRGAVRPWRRG
jgi:hypothetical protein